MLKQTKVKKKLTTERLQVRVLSLMKKMKIQEVQVKIIIPQSQKSQVILKTWMKKMKINKQVGRYI